jgi:predicted transcriptional regulator
MSKLQIHVGEGFDAMAARALDACRRAEQGEGVGENHLTFDSWQTLAKVLTPKRMELLHHLRRHPSASIAALARELGRDYKRVHEDVEHLSELGLIERGEDGGVRVEVDEIRASIAL